MLSKDPDSHDDFDEFLLHKVEIEALQAGKINRYGLWRSSRSHGLRIIEVWRGDLSDTGVKFLLPGFVGDIDYIVPPLAAAEGETVPTALGGRGGVKAVVREVSWEGGMCSGW